MVAISSLDGFELPFLAVAWVGFMLWIASVGFMLWIASAWFKDDHIRPA